MKEPDEIMAEYLLQGGKMLSKACTVCGSPLFEIKGKTRCVVCESARKAQPAPAESGTVHPPARNEPAVQNVPAPEPAAPLPPGPLQNELSETILLLCRRIQNEPDPDRCLLLMKCVRQGVLALKNLT
ncbi:MAG TPA: Sjogren's syndrome/scleroderma autoantigen 1 family protein [Methanomicrobiales archaeon]|nr:Sjogren's syndrome/scleroderma autoantigen 1 family protein [Methanomicrobiales archaeon]